MNKEFENNNFENMDDLTENHLENTTLPPTDETESIPPVEFTSSSLPEEPVAPSVEEIYSVSQPEQTESEPDSTQMKPPTPVQDSHSDPSHNSFSEIENDAPHSEEIPQEQAAYNTNAYNGATGYPNPGVQQEQPGYQYNQEYPYGAGYGQQVGGYQNPYYGYNTVPQSPVQPKTKPRKERKKGSGAALKIAAIALVCALAGGAVGGVATYALVSGGRSSGSSLSGGNTVQNVKIDDSYNSSVEAIADKVLPSVVGIKTTFRQTSGGSIFGFGGGQSSQASSEGSGVVYTQDGYIITNYHVVQDASSNGGTINVYLNENKDESYPATLIGYDAGADLAVIKIEKTGLTPIEFGESSSLKVGQLAVAIGNPGGLDFMGSVSQGIVSGLNRTITLESGVSMELIQTDAAINPGNSGGALVDGTGKLIGINSAKLASDGFEGMGFAIPSDDVKTITDRLINNQGKKSAYLGISIDSRYTAEVLEQMGYPSGVVVASVVEGGPAETAGLTKGDIITSVQGTAIPSYDILVSELTKYSPGEQVQMEVFRLGQTQAITVTLGETSSQQSSTSSR